eukprot:CAMPEP_0197634270 /NCGR_PEP_ID=MMETSP1338-20131121/10406_1 /TAXON_ID=43686 ORGANISM="Pelagodinium beii, Strain RCC1491" /NCGR_SAMPLE_ID=MMETSP1338 /ASSEMBLY_ACC=CAM_ASM_000754 /LENGTH=343 /DNA_ID=CAMNT_0043206097 /DNA_START=125 /DNA_END=1153 /DNA_ORIENTATION=+
MQFAVESGTSIQLSSVHDQHPWALTFELSGLSGQQHKHAQIAPAVSIASFADQTEPGFHRNLDGSLWQNVKHPAGCTSWVLARLDMPSRQDKFPFISVSNQCHGHPLTNHSGMCLLKPSGTIAHLEVLPKNLAPGCTRKLCGGQIWSSDESKSLESSNGRMDEKELLSLDLGRRRGMLDCGQFAALLLGKDMWNSADLSQCCVGGWSSGSYISSGAATLAERASQSPCAIYNYDTLMRPPRVTVMDSCVCLNSVFSVVRYAVTPEWRPQVCLLNIVVASFCIDLRDELLLMTAERRARAHLSSKVYMEATINDSWHCVIGFLNGFETGLALRTVAGRSSQQPL